MSNLRRARPARQHVDGEDDGIYRLGLRIHPESLARDERLAADHPLISLDHVIRTLQEIAWTEALVGDEDTEECRKLLSVSPGELPGGTYSRCAR